MSSTAWVSAVRVVMPVPVLIMILVAAMLTMTGCGPDAEDGNPGVLEADVLFTDTSTDPETGPGGGLKVVAIVQAGGISGEFFAFASESGDEIIITGFESSTGEQDFFAEFDEFAHLDRVTIEDLESTFEYNDNGTFSYVIERGDMLLSGSGLSVPRQTGKIAHSRTQRIETTDIVACREAAVRTWADSVEQEAAGDAGATAPAQFVECLLDVTEI